MREQDQPEEDQALFTVVLVGMSAKKEISLKIRRRLQHHHQRWVDSAARNSSVRYWKEMISQFLMFVMPGEGMSVLCD